MKLLHRIQRLERRIGQPQEVTWQEAYAASDRYRQRARASLQAHLDKTEPPHDEQEEARDEDILRRWRRQRGLPPDPPDGARRWLLAKLLEMKRRMGTSPCAG